jgi:hypothetical protein
VGRGSWVVGRDNYRCARCSSTCALCTLPSSGTSPSIACHPILSHHPIPPCTARRACPRRPTRARQLAAFSCTTLLSCASAGSPFPCLLTNNNASCLCPPRHPLTARPPAPNPGMTSPHLPPAPPPPPPAPAPASTQTDHNVPTPPPLPPRSLLSPAMQPPPAYSSVMAMSSQDPRSSSTQSLVPDPASNNTGRRRLLLVYIHGFMGNETSFRSFPAHVHNLVSLTLADSHVIHTKIYPRYRARFALQVARDEFSAWSPSLLPPVASSR